MTIEEHWRGIDQPGTIARGGSPFEVHAQQRVAAFLDEVQRDRLARSARGGPGSKALSRFDGTVPTLLSAASSAVIEVARRLAIQRPGRNVS